MRPLHTCAAGAALLACAGAAHASFVAATHTGGGTIITAPFAVTGWEFTATDDLVVTHLGIWDHLGNGLNSRHEIGLFRKSDFGHIASTTLFGGTDAPLIQGSRFAEIDAVTLHAGESYYILADNMGADPFVFGEDAVAFAPQIQWNGYVDADGMTIFDQPQFFGGLPGNLGPNFLFIPAPAGLTLLAGAGLLGLRRRR